MDLTKKKCVPCEGSASKLTESEENEFINQIKNWQIHRDGIHKIRKEFMLLHFRDAMSFVNQIADLAESEGHHPNISIIFNLVIIEIFTHAIGGLSENDFILGAKIDDIFNLEYHIAQ